MSENGEIYTAGKKFTLTLIDKDGGILGIARRPRRGSGRAGLPIGWSL